MSEISAVGRVQGRLTRDRRRTLVAFGFAVIVFAVGAFLHRGFASWGSVNAIVEVASFVGFVAAGQTLVILVGGIDLSVPWVLNAAGILFAVFSLGHSGRAVPAVLLALGLGFAIGAVNGFCVAYLAVPAVVMTLAMNGIMEGVTLGLTKGLTCTRCNSYAPRVLQDFVHKDLLGVPADLILWFGVVLLVTVVLSYTTFGRKVYATGNNPTAAYLSGMNVRLVTTSLYALSGMFAALAGIVLVSYSGQPTLGMGDPFLFQSIAAAVIGGISILGGRGNYLGTVAGAVSLVALISLLGAENMPDYGRSIVYGVAILVVLVLFGREERV
ncbi:MAG TPA: ABC transporter permease [Gaiellaceae bacterium]|nr:ABC transporter permease [Gaiellaceae bacterium]